MWGSPDTYNTLNYREGGRVVAHDCVIPITLPLAAGDVKTFSVVDWAATVSIRGVRRSLISDLTALVDVRLAFGGSTMGRQLLHRSKLSAPFSSWRRQSRCRSAGPEFPHGRWR